MKTIGLICAAIDIFLLVGMTFLVLPRYRHDKDKLDQIAKRTCIAALPFFAVELVAAAIVVL